MMRRSAIAALLATLAPCLLLMMAPAGHAQDAILSFSWTPEALTVPPGGEATVRLVARNETMYEGDDLELEFELGETGIEAAVEPALLAKIPAFGEASVRVTLRLPEDADEGTIALPVYALYTYCIGESCFLLEEPLTLSITVDAGAEPLVLPPATIEEPFDPWPPIVLGVVLAGFVIALLLARRPRWRIAAMAVLLIAGGIGLAYGTLRWQHEQAQSIGASLCISCVGLEPTTHHPPELTDGEKAILAEVAEPYELLVFSATWCHACPIAKAFVAAVDDASPGITHRVVDVEEEPGVAETYGVVRAGRTIVPAIARADTAEMFFGTEDLKARLFALLGLTGRFEGVGRDGSER
jgi:thiol-disulfide isomerase/thioredoxin